MVSIFWLSLLWVSCVFSTINAMLDCLWVVSWSWCELQAVVFRLADLCVQYLMVLVVGSLICLAEWILFCWLVVSIS